MNGEMEGASWRERSLSSGSGLRLGQARCPREAKKFQHLLVLKLEHVSKLTQN